ncbi:MAG: FHA domain-containing protein [Paracoccaceae bacterium]
MKFIREMIARKHRSPDLDMFPDEDDFEVGNEARGETSPKAPVSMPSIQARLQSALDKSETHHTKKTLDESCHRPVEDFRDIVGSKAKQKSRDSEEDELTGEAGLEVEVAENSQSDLTEEMDSEADVVPPKTVATTSSAEESIDLENMNAHEPSVPAPSSDEGLRNKATPPSQDTANPPQTSEAVEPANLRQVASSDQATSQTQLPTEPKANLAEQSNEASEGESDDMSVISANLSRALLSEVAMAPPAANQMVEVPAPAAGRSGRRAGRVKTRLLGFEHAHGASPDPFEATIQNAETPQGKFPVGWIVVVKGPGRGTSFTLNNGVSQIGRGDDQAVKLDFGDSSISRSNHAAIAYDGEQRAFFLGHGGKANLVRLNDKPVLSTEEISDGDLIRIGETVLRFVGLCGQDFHWETGDQEDMDDAAIA